MPLTTTFRNGYSQKNAMANPHYNIVLSVVALQCYIMSTAVLNGCLLNFNLPVVLALGSVIISKGSLVERVMSINTSV